MKRLFGDAEIAEISLCWGMFNLPNRFNDTLWIDIDPHDFNPLQRGAVSGRSSEDIKVYAGRFPEVGAAARQQQRAAE